MPTLLLSPEHGKEGGGRAHSQSLLDVTHVVELVENRRLSTGARVSGELGSSVTLLSHTPSYRSLSF